MIRTISSILCMCGLLAGGIVMLKNSSDYNSQIGLLIGGAFLTAISTCIIFIACCTVQLGTGGTSCFYKMCKDDMINCKKLYHVYKNKKTNKQTIPIIQPISPDTLTIRVQQA